MFIKTIRHKSNSIKRLLEYIFEGIQDKDYDWVMAHNLPSLRHTEMVNAFLENDQYRSNHAKVRWYHEVLSFNPLDREKITDKLLWDIARKYIDLRNPNALVYAAPHKSEQHIHIHFAFSGVEYKSRSTLRMDDRTFRSLQRNMEKYQLDKYPELFHSFAYLHREKDRNLFEERDRNTRQEALFQSQRKHPKKVQEKARLTDLVTRLFSESQSQAEFFDKVRSEGLELYEYRSKIKGINTNRKYRFSTIGISNEQLRGLDQLARRWREMEDLSRDGDGRNIL